MKILDSTAKEKMMSEMLCYANTHKMYHILEYIVIDMEGTIYRLSSEISPTRT
jgi:hypothetical protein